MKIIKTAYERFGAIPIGLGRAGENGVVQISVDISTPLEEYPDAYFGINAETPDGTEYPVVCETQGKTLLWTVNASDTSKSGKGRAQVVMYGANGEIGRSKPVDTLVLPSIIANGNPPDPVQNWLDNVQNASGGAFAPMIVTTAAGDAISDAAGGRASSVVATLNPKLEDGSLAPNPEGGTFVPWREGKLNVNGTEIAAHIPGEPYVGTYDFVKGVANQSGVRVYKASDAFELSTSTPPSVNSQGLKYIRLQLKAGVYDVDMPSQFIVCNRYARQDTSPYFDKCLRVSNTPYIYDNDIDLENPLATLEGLEFLLSVDSGELHVGEGQEIVLKKGNNIITSDSGDVTVEYGVDTKTYIDNKFAELCAALLGG